MRYHVVFAVFFAVASLASVCPAAIPAEHGAGGDDLSGAWRGQVVIDSGAFSTMKDLEFMYAFNAGGTMTESSNYDAAPPGPPAYGVWKKTGVRQYEARYVVFMTKAVSIQEEITNGGGWSPDGYGVLSEKITLSEDGDSFASTIKFEIFDPQGKLTTRGGDGTVKAKRITF
jgi:hypothetical protein